MNNTLDRRPTNFYKELVLKQVKKHEKLACLTCFVAQVVFWYKLLALNNVAQLCTSLYKNLHQNLLHETYARFLSACHGYKSAMLHSNILPFTCGIYAQNSFTLNVW